MKKALKLLSISLLAVSVVAGGGCSSGDGDKKPTQPGATLTLSISKSSILADGKDATQLSVYYSATQEDVTSKAELYVNDTPLTSSTFTTTTAGSYTFKAVYEGVTSNQVTATAVSGETADGITLTASKTTIYADGGDFALLTLKTADGADVTAQGSFYANGEPIEGNRFSSSKSALVPVTVTAKFNGLDVKNSVSILASNSVSFTNRVLLEDVTKTNCKYCPLIINLIEELRKDTDPRVVPFSIHNFQSDIYTGYYSESTRTQADAFYDFMAVANKSEAPAPLAYANRNTTKLQQDNVKAEDLRVMALNGPQDVALTLESSLEGSTLSVKTTVGSKKNFSGKIVVVLVESGIYANQQTMGYIEMYRIMRQYAPSIEGEPKTFTANTPVTYSTTFNLSDLKVVSSANCEVIAFVTDDADGLCENVQFAKLGEVKSY